MIKDYIELYNSSKKSNDLLMKYLIECVGKRYKYTNYQDETFYITVDYVKSIDEIGISHVEDRGTEESHMWDSEEFYEIMKDSIEIN